MKGVMIQGTASNVGKSLLTTAMCRLFNKKGYATAPFKAQNMSNRTILTESGKEMSMAQAQQAAAAKLSPSVIMNPIVLKPSENHLSEVIFMGEKISTIHGGDYQTFYYKQARQTIESALKQLDAQYDLIFLEGAGSPVEMNLKARDLANMALANIANVPVILTADIDRGGAFASIVGTLALLEPEERSRVKGLLINKFHGDVTTFTSGSNWLETYTGIPVLGVIPYVDHNLADEDGLAASEGLTTTSMLNGADYEKLATHLEKYLDWKKLLTIMQGDTHAH
ncbi:hypothetical protein GCM10007063_22320 [Lentibacillus kapialis]|uniref:Cobyric acid synthase n=1 Tax=Lentibacillus kapialis TaxID=340214 RepID=A0A917UZ77_9BACI|nr:cobyric acid synthase [Lentibacillus kapialis]GGJ99512.1 hypothetical protein GCM10007063_22320 [Lentibacillus kapialis]